MAQQSKTSPQAVLLHSRGAGFSQLGGVVGGRLRCHPFPGYRREGCGWWRPGSTLDSSRRPGPPPPRAQVAKEGDCWLQPPRRLLMERYGREAWDKQRSVRKGLGIFFVVLCLKGLGFFFLQGLLSN